MKKLLIGMVLSFIAPFLLLVPIIGAAASVEGFYDPSSGEDFDVETFKTSSIVTTVKSWYDEYINECESTMNERKTEVEKEHTTIEIIQKPGEEQESDTQENDKPETDANEQADTERCVSVRKMKGSKFEEIAVEQPREPTAKPQPDEVSKDEGEDETESDSEDNQEPGTEEREVCHVNVIITMDDFPLSAVLAYYNVLYIQGMMSGEGFSVPSKDKVHDMLSAMTEYSELEDDDSEDYYIVMQFKDYHDLPAVEIAEWELSDEEYDEYMEMYLNVTEMVAGWLDEELNEEDKYGEEVQ